MQDRTYSDLLTLIRSLAGAGSFTEQEQASILSFVNRRASEAYSMSQSWPRYLTVGEERDICNYSLSGITGDNADAVNGGYTLLGKFASGELLGSPGSNIYVDTASFNTNTLTGTAILEDSTGVVNILIDLELSRQPDGDYISISGTGTQIATNSDPNTSIDDLSNAIRWSVLSSVAGGYPTIEDVQVVTYDQSNKANIGEAIRVHRLRPFLNNSTLEFEFYVDSFGINILNLSPKTSATAYVTYNKELGQFTDESTDIPSEWFAFMAHASYADFLRLDGQAEKAIAEEQVAQKYISMELEKVDNVSNHNTALKRFSTYTSRQAR